MENTKMLASKQAKLSYTWKREKKNLSVFPLMWIYLNISLSCTFPGLIMQIDELEKK